MQSAFRSQRRVLYGANGSTYEIGHKLGDGGMSDVYLARHKPGHVVSSEGRLVALKLLRPGTSSRARRLFYHECRLLPQLQHPHIIGYVDHGRGALVGSGTLDFLALRYVCGESLENLLRRQQKLLAHATVLGIIAQLTTALSYLHQRGITHCDLKPGNIMLQRVTPSAVLIDFGTAHSPDFASTTVAVGTPQYMAPEQADPRYRCDARSDIYTLGILIFELLAGRRLFPDRTPTDLRARPIQGPNIDELLATVDHSVASVVARCLCVDPAGRYSSVESLFHDLCQAMRQGSGSS